MDEKEKNTQTEEQEEQEKLEEAFRVFGFGKPVSPAEYDRETAIAAFLEYLTARYTQPEVLEANPDRVLAEVTYRGPDSDERMWIVQGGKIIPIPECDERRNRKPNYFLNRYDRTYISFSFEKNHAHIGHVYGPLFGRGFAYDFGFTEEGKLVLANPRMEWIS